MRESAFQKKRIKAERDSLAKQFLFLILALIPAVLLAGMLIFFANKVSIEYKENYDPQDYQYFSSSDQAQPSYWHYLQKQKETKIKERSQLNQSKNAVDKLMADWENQRDQLKFQQEQQKLEQQRIKQLLKQFKTR
ncbi:MAG TPA: hypothetical protein PLU24_01005 [Candidatus Omnitrophota bacterium]|nr:hypothetical protein [Candidatus Omnitrophota bacterium]